MILLLPVLVLPEGGKKCVMVIVPSAGAAMTLRVYCLRSGVVVVVLALSSSSVVMDVVGKRKIRFK
jgi:hypothetical protein